MKNKSSRSFYLSIIFWLFFFNSFAQKSIKIGVKIMPEMAAATKIAQYDSKLSLSGGLQGILFLNKYIGIETGVYYQNRGYQLKNTFRKPNGKIHITKYNYYYLSFPLLLRGRYKSIYASVGLSYDIFLLYYQMSLDERLFMDNSDKSKFNLSALGSFGYERMLSPKLTAYLELRINSNLLKYLNYASNNDLRMYNYGIGIGIHYDIRK